MVSWASQTILPPRANRDPRFVTKLADWVTELRREAFKPLNSGIRRAETEGAFEADEIEEVIGRENTRVTVTESSKEAIESSEREIWVVERERCLVFVGCLIWMTPEKPIDSTHICHVFVDNFFSDFIFFRHVILFSYALTAPFFIGLTINFLTGYFKKPIPVKTTCTKPVLAWASIFLFFFPVQSFHNTGFFCFRALFNFSTTSLLPKMLKETVKNKRCNRCS